MGEHDAAGGEAARSAAAELLRALAHATRLHLVQELEAGPRCVHELVAATGVDQPLVSSHLRVLKAAGIVGRERRERRGREVAYELTDSHVARIARDSVEHAQEEL